MAAGIAVIECVDRKEVFEEFKRLIRQDQKEEDNEEVKEAFECAIQRLQNILF